MARFSKLHPCYGFLHCQPDHYRQIYNRLCQMRDDDIKAGNLTGGMPTGFQNWAFEDLKTNSEARKEVGKSLAIFSAFTEGVALYSSFAVLYSFQMRNKLKGIGQQMKWSVRDESLHSKMGCQLFRHMCDEYPELLDECKESIEEAARLIVDLEIKYIDKMLSLIHI